MEYRPRGVGELSSGAPCWSGDAEKSTLLEGGHFTPSCRDHLTPTDSLEPGDVGESTARLYC